MGGNGTDRPSGRPWRAILAVLAATIGAATIVALVLMLNTATAARDRALDSRARSYEAVILARTLQAEVGGAEAYLGRFVISGDKELGRRFIDNWRQAGATLDTLDDAVADPGAGPLITKLREAYAARGEELSAVALRTNYGRNPEALSKYYTAGNSPTLGAIDSLIDQVIAQERALLDTRVAVADASVDRSNWLGAAVSGFGLVLVAGAALLGWIALLGWRSRREEARRNDDLEDAVADRTAELVKANDRLRAEMITRANAEEALRQAQKMDAIGQLTGGIAHDFNNMLAVVMSGIELAKRRLANDRPSAERHLDNALTGAVRAAALTKRLLAFARAEPLLPVATNAHALVLGMADLFERTLGEGVTVAIEGDSEVWPVCVDQHQLENALLNLAVNARDAMPGGGTLTVRTENVTLAAPGPGGIPEGGYCRITVSDTGGGMTPDIVARIFEPFFTTKPVDRGTGLGLSQIFGFVQQSGGAIDVQSQPGAGTSMAIYLPRYDGAVGAATLLNTAEAMPVSTRQHGLVTLAIEDDVRVLDATVAALGELGHEPIACSAPAEVPGILRQRRDIGLIVSDVVMPGISGPELVSAIRVLHPNIPVVFVTGYAGDVDDAAAFGGHEVVRKPFTVAALGAAIDRALDRAEVAQAA